MNERIRQCWLRAAKEDSGDTWDSQEKFIERFAELIVGECAQSLWTEECYTSDLALEEFRKNSKKIKQHFGVEE